MTRSDPGRREFLVRGAQMTGAAASVGLAWLALVKGEAHAAANALRPPGALPEREFAGRCLKCGQCVRACPYGTLKLAPLAGPVAIGTPYFEPRQVPCYLCADLPCTKACPSGALDRALVDATQARMGVAVIDEASCLSWQGLRCEICHRACPVRGQAIRIETTPRRTSRHAVFEPVVDAAHCTGCGLCERACPTEVAAIRVLRAEYARGSVGAHYRLPERAVREPEIDAPPAAPAPPADNPATTVPGLDYLNRREPL